MGSLSVHVRRWRAGIILALLAATLAAPGAALAENLTCTPRETLVRIDEKTCEPNGKRPLIVVKRACCANPQGRVHCDSFKHCPRESPS